VKASESSVIVLAALVLSACAGDLGAIDTSDQGAHGANGTDPSSANSSHSGQNAGNDSAGDGDTSGSHEGGGNGTSGDGDATSSGDGDGTVVSGNCGARPAAPERGAALPYWEHEAEDADSTGVLLSESRTFGDIQAEASGRRAVRLEATGQRVEFTTDAAINSIVVRFAIPDAAQGGGAEATLGLYINGVRKDLKLTSRYSWVYGDEDAQGQGNDSPGAGKGHHFYDEVHTLFDEVPAGSKIALQRDSQDSAQFYVIDLVDFESVCAPLAQPDNSLSITDFGATPNDASDDGPAIQKAIDAAKQQGKSVWIPAGSFESTSVPFSVSDVTIRGAGMWHSVLHGFWAQFKVSGNNNVFSDFNIQGDVTYRDDQQGWNGFDGPAGTGSRLENVWIEHTKVGWWVGKGAYQGVPTAPLTDGLVIHGVRVRNTMADGINLANGTSNTVIEHSSIRNTGDDGLATWSYSLDGPPCQNNTFRFNTVQNVWRATCLAIYGGKDHKIQDNTCADTSNYPGIFLATTGAFAPHPFDGTTLVERNTLTRAGGQHYGYGHGAFKIFSDFNAIHDVRVTDLVVDSPTFFGLHFEGTQPVSNISFDGVDVSAYGSAGIWVAGNARGSAQLDNVSLSGAANKGVQNDAPSAFTLAQGQGNSGL
jgi:hypothetical protein